MTPDELCARIDERLASVSARECRTLDLEPGDAVSVEGRPLLVKTYPPRPDREPLGRVLLVGGLHGDEHASVSVVFKWMGMLDRLHSGLFHWRIVPLLNPDGLLHTEPRRMNANGVDLNHNFAPPGGHGRARAHWIRHTDRNPRSYPGPKALSEPESRWLTAEMRRFRPDAVVAVHAPHGSDEYRRLDAATETAPLGRLVVQQPATYPGTLARYVSEELGAEFLTLELPYADRMPSDAEMASMWRDLLRRLEVRVTARPGISAAAVK